MGHGPRAHGPIGPRAHWARGPWVMGPWAHGPWNHGPMGHGPVHPWAHGHMGPCTHGPMGAGHLGGGSYSTIVVRGSYYDKSAIVVVVSSASLESAMPVTILSSPEHQFSKGRCLSRPRCPMHGGLIHATCRPKAPPNKRPMGPGRMGPGVNAQGPQITLRAHGPRGHGPTDRDMGLGPCRLAYFFFERKTSLTNPKRRATKSLIFLSLQP